MKKYILLFNCPSVNNDKEWLVDGFKERGLEYRIVETKLYHCTMMQKGNKQYIRYFGRIFWQAFRGFCISKKNDVIVCWSSFTANFVNIMNIVTGNKRQIFSLGWLTPKKDKPYWKYLRIKQIQNIKCRIAVNTQSGIKKWLDWYGLPDIGNIFFVPDVIDSNIEFAEIQNIEEKKNKYIFCGGMANRDWNMVVKLALYFKSIKFVCCALEYDWKSKVKEYPENIEVYFNISPEKYYESMQNSYLVILPLIDNQTSGLINITHSAQYGVLCMTSKYEFSEMYFSDESQEFLISNYQQWVDEIERVFSFEWNEYLNKINDFQHYIKDNFSPNVALKKIIQMDMEYAKNEQL
jgi:hypothetical protein